MRYNICNKCYDWYPHDSNCQDLDRDGWLEAHNSKQWDCDECKKEHALTEHAWKTNWSCIKCEQEFNKGKSMGCRECNFDVCKECHGAATD